nr:MAG TPA: hypothetical protein [Caudoviricetes sp.]
MKDGAKGNTKKILRMYIKSIRKTAKYPLEGRR